MAYVSVPKDLTKVKNKVAFNLTKRQLICIGIGAAMGIPSYVYFSFFQALNLNFPVIQTESCLLNLFNLNQQHHRSTHFITHSRHTHHICRRHCFLNSLNLKTTFYKWIQYLR